MPGSPPKPSPAPFLCRFRGSRRKIGLQRRHQRNHIPKVTPVTGVKQIKSKPLVGYYTADCKRAPTTIHVEEHARNNSRSWSNREIQNEVDLRLQNSVADLPYTAASFGLHADSHLPISLTIYTYPLNRGCGWKKPRERSTAIPGCWVYLVPSRRRVSDQRRASPGGTAPDRAAFRPNASRWCTHPPRSLAPRRAISKY